MGIVKSVLAFICGVVALFLFYYFVSLPIVPCLTVYITGELFLSEDGKGLRSRMVFVLLLTLLGISFYALNTWGMIRTYPNNGNVLAIIFEVVNVFAFIGAGVMNFIGLLSTSESKTSKKHNI